VVGKKGTKPDDFAAVAESAVASTSDPVEEAEELLL